MLVVILRTRNNGQQRVLDTSPKNMLPCRIPVAFVLMVLVTRSDPNSWPLLLLEHVANRCAKAQSQVEQVLAINIL